MSDDDGAGALGAAAARQLEMDVEQDGREAHGKLPPSERQRLHAATGCLQLPAPGPLSLDFMEQYAALISTAALSRKVPHKGFVQRLSFKKTVSAQ